MAGFQVFTEAAAGLARMMHLPETSVAMPIHPLG